LSRLGSLLADWGTAWSRLEPERRNGVLLFGGLGLIVLIALALIGWGYYNENIAYKNDVVLTVGGREFDYAAIERRLTRELRRGSLTAGSAEEAGLSAILLIEEEELLRQGARNLGIVVSDAELDEQIRGAIGVPADAPAADFAAVYRRSVLDSGLSVSEYRDLTARPLLIEKLRDQFSASIPAETEQVDLLLILTFDRERADAAKQRLEAGEAFAEVATTASDHVSASEGGAAGWFPLGSMADRLSEAAFSLPLGETSDVIDVSAGYARPTAFYIIQPQAREVRPLDEDGRDAIIDQSYEDFLFDTAAQIGSVRSLTTKHLAELAAHAIAVVSGG
jgi:hypothetical protein